MTGRPASGDPLSAADPDLQFFGFSLWIDRRQFPDARDYWDGNWLMVRARMQASLAVVRCEGPILMTADIARFRNELVAMADTLAGDATLKPLEPGLSIVLTMQDGGHMLCVIEMTPDHLSQYHRFKVEADQSYLPALIASCDAILSRFPVVNTGAW